MQIDTKLATLTKLIKYGNPRDVFNLKNIPDKSTYEIQKELRIQSTDMRQNIKTAEHIVRGYTLGNSKIKKNISLLIAIEISNNQNLEKIKKMLDKIIVLEHKKQIQYILTLMCKASETIKKSVKEPVNIHFFQLIKNTLREVKTDDNND